VHHRVGDSFAHGHVDTKRRLFIQTAALDEIRHRGSRVSNRLNVAGQNESSRLFGHRRRGLSRPKSRFGCCYSVANRRRTCNMAAGRVSRSWVANGSCPMVSCSFSVTRTIHKITPTRVSLRVFSRICLPGKPTSQNQRLLICRDCAGPLP